MNVELSTSQIDLLQESLASLWESYTHEVKSLQQLGQAPQIAQAQASIEHIDQLSTHLRDAQEAI